MQDPFPIAVPPLLFKATQPLATALNLPALPLHIHEVLTAVILYTTIYALLSPPISNLLTRGRYSRMPPRTQINWNVHVVSFVQSTLICTLSLHVLLHDPDRRAWSNSFTSRVWGYSPIAGLLQSFGLGYFLWDLYMCAARVDIFGVGMLLHAMAATAAFSFGYRPFLHYYAPVFLLYELSSPFLNIHWFCDKLGLTGSVYQAVNGFFLTSVFFGCRLVWGLVNSGRVWGDLIRAVREGAPEEEGFPGGRRDVPVWLVATYLAANGVLNCLNVYWFGKMIQTIRSRFPPPLGTKGVGKGEGRGDGKVVVEGEGREVDGLRKRTRRV
ncbi:DUF887-domain-containing protein [Piedraia hortae CBS 480.64]|uniref:DUF887-domain-containing protein n=1 Tax=Piedraia hortae CBS 480.64 TaxID=1314780 RepID=A0A6A7CAU0_9PEZI|nr:DUF887-domain-containing protein [Piedraia hortae CBS 480.64]